MSFAARSPQRRKESSAAFRICLLNSIILGISFCSSFSFPPRNPRLHACRHRHRHRQSPWSRKQARTHSSSCISLSSSVADTFGKTIELKYTEFSGSDAAGNDNYDGDPAIILHGLLGSKRNFASLGSSLAAQLSKRRRIIAVDLRNHGENSEETWTEDMSYSGMARDVVIGLLDRLEISSCVLIGHSMGGKAAKAAALLYPERVSGLVVMDIAPVEYTCERDAHWSTVKGTIDAIAGVSLEGKTKRDVDLALRATVEDPALRAFVLTNLREDRQSGNLNWKINVEGIERQLETIAGFDIGQDGESSIYHGETLIIKGGASRFVQNSHVEAISKYFPNYLLTSIRGAGHWIHAEAPDDTLAILKKYLDR